MQGIQGTTGTAGTTLMPWIAIGVKLGLELDTKASSSVYKFFGTTYHADGLCTALGVYRVKDGTLFQCGSVVKVRPCKRGKLVGKTYRKAADRQYFILEMHKNFCAGVLSARLLDRQRELPRCFDIQLASVMLGIGATLSPEEVRLALSTASADEKVSVSESSSEGTGDRDLDTNRAGSVGSVRKRKRAGSPVKGGKTLKVKAGQNAPAASKVTAANSKALGGAPKVSGRGRKGAAGTPGPKGSAAKGAVGSAGPVGPPGPPGLCSSTTNAGEARLTAKEFSEFAAAGDFDYSTIHDTL